MCANPFLEIGPFSIAFFFSPFSRWPFSPFFLPFSPFSRWPEEHQGISETAEKGLFPQISSDLLKPPSLKPHLQHSKGFFKRVFCNLAWGGFGKGVGEGLGRGWGRVGEGLAFETSKPRLKDRNHVP